MTDGIALMTRIHAAEATIAVLDRPALDLTTPRGRTLLGLLSAIYEEERSRITERARQSLKQARRNGKLPGRHPKLSAEDANAIRKRIRDNPNTSYRTIATDYDVHHQTISRIAKNKDR